MQENEILELIRFRLEQAHDVLKDALLLLNSERTPLSIINRSYYAMFYAVLALLQLTDSIPHKHAGVISKFDTEFISKGIFPKEMSKDLHLAFELRQKFDYRISKPIALGDDKKVYEKAKLFVKEVSEYLIKKTSVVIKSEEKS